MKPACCIALLLICVVMAAVSTFAQTPPDAFADRAVAALKQASDGSAQLVRDLTLARRAGNVARVRELEKGLFTEVPQVEQPAGQFTFIRGEEGLEKTAGPLWGNDVKIYTGRIYSYGKRQVVTDSDTSGGIYAAFNAVYNDSLSNIYVYRSTNGGKNWGQIALMRYGALPIQSFDMCVTDTAGGKWLIGIAAVVKTDKSANGGGALWWLSVLNDGTGFRQTLIANSTTTTGYRNPSICTDGTNYAPTGTYHYIAAECVTPSNDSSRSLYIRRTIDWGKTWGNPDTTIRGFREGTPVIGITWGTNPDSLLVGFSRTFTTGQRVIRVASNTLSFTTVWDITYPIDAKDDYDPAMAINPTTRDAMISYTRATGAPTYNDAMYLYSRDLFHTFTKDSIAVTASNEELTSISYAPWPPSYYWRVAYRTSGGTDSINYKGLYGAMAGFYTTPPTHISQYLPSTMITPAVGFDRDIGGTFYRGNVLYVGSGPQNIYFDAVDLALDVPQTEEVPMQYALNQNFPNPFNPTSTIGYELPAASTVKLVVFDLLGREVRTLVNERKEAGKHSLHFNVAGLASGVYLYRLVAGDFVQTKKMAVIK